MVYRVPKAKKKFKTETEYFRYTDKITDAFYDGDLNRLGKLMGKKFKTLRGAENYFNEIWKKKIKIGK